MHPITQEMVEDAVAFARLLRRPATILTPTAPTVLQRLLFPSFTRILATDDEATERWRFHQACGRVGTKWCETYDYATDNTAPNKFDADLIRKHRKVGCKVVWDNEADGKFINITPVEESHQIFLRFNWNIDQGPCLEMMGYINLETINKTEWPKYWDGDKNRPYITFDKLSPVPQLV